LANSQINTSSERGIMDELTKMWSDGSLINEKALDDPNVLSKVQEIFKGTIYDVTEEE